MPGPSTPTAHALPAAEIESLLRSAQRNVRQPLARDLDEELGPGDVQHFRGNSMTLPNLEMAAVTTSEWPENSRDPESLLRQVEQQLADAMRDSPHERPTPAIGSHTAASARTQATNRSMPSKGLTLDDLGDVDLDISIELGRTEILIEDVLKLREGSVVSLNKFAGDPVDIVANGRLVARGELLVIDGKFGVRLSEVL